MNYLTAINNIEITSCPHCRSTYICKYGHVKTRQRYKCKECTRTFTSYTNKPWSNSKVDISIWNRYLSLMENKLTLEECSRILHINIKTAFNIRHKIMMAIEEVENKLLCGEVEVIRRRYYENRKGSKRIHGDRKQYNLHFGIDNTHNTFLDLDTRNMSVKLAEEVLNRNISNDAIILSSNNRFINLARCTIRKICPIKCINACREYTCYELWHEDFRGVATRYIYRYYYWYKSRKNLKTIFYGACL